MGQRQHRGFTLVEIMIVVVIIGILAAIVIPMHYNTSDKVRFSATLQSLQTLRGQIDLYRNQHEGRFPGQSGAFPDTTLVEQLTLPTNRLGERSSAINQGHGDINFPLGPYVTTKLPVNPFNRSRSVSTVDKFPANAPGGSAASSPGWFYEIGSGRIRVNDNGTAPNGLNYWDL